MVLPQHPKWPPSSDELVLEPGEPMESARHLHQMTHLIESLEYAWRARTDFYVAGDMFLYFSETQARRNDFRGPDVLIVLDTTRRERKAWVVWEEDGKVPDVIIELLSDTTEKIDRGEKMRLYARLRVGEYFLFHPFTGVLEGYELDVLHSRYVRKQPRPDGSVWSERLELGLKKVNGALWGVRADWLRWIDAEGAVLELPMEAAIRIGERANAEAERANAEAERANGLAAEIERLKGELARRERQ